MSLRLDWCSYEAAKYAVMHWHYSGVYPAGKTVKVGVWEDDRFIGVVVFSLGANRHIGDPYGLPQEEICELVRVALREHQMPTSKIVSGAVKMLSRQSPDLRLICSYADPGQGHLGILYQATNWIYVGRTNGGTAQILLPDGSRLHKRTAYSALGRCDASAFGGTWVQPPEKHKYLYPFDRAMRRQIAPLAQPYPKRLDHASA